MFRAHSAATHHQKMTFWLISKTVSQTSGTGSYANVSDASLNLHGTCLQKLGLTRISNRYDLHETELKSFSNVVM